MLKAFTSEEFEADPNAFRYMAWTDRRVQQINQIIRGWSYVDNIPTPFMPGESALFRAPVIVDHSIIFADSREAKILSIAKPF